MSNIDKQANEVKITLREDTDTYLDTFDPEKFYVENKFTCDLLFEQFATAVGEDPKKASRTIGLLNYLVYEKARQSFDLTSVIALLSGASASTHFGEKLFELLKIAYRLQEAAEDPVQTGSSYAFPGMDGKHY